MRKILIVNKSFETGGIQSSLVNMVNELQKYYQVELFIYYPKGPMRERLDPNVRIIPASWRFKALAIPLKETLQSRDLRIIFFKTFAVIWSKLFDNKFPISIAIRHQEIMKDYDIAIAYHQEQGKHSSLSGFSRVVDSCVVARKKIAWLHYDNSKLDLDSAYNNHFYAKMDNIVCVSRALSLSFVTQFPQFKNRTLFCYNFLDYDKIIKKSNEEQLVTYPRNKIICFSACRLTREKAIVRAVKALAPVFREHCECFWYIAGDGDEKNNIDDAISEEGMKTQVILLGQQNNPYPFMKNADIVMNLSYHEAAPMVFMEAKVLGKPVFATRTSSAEELLVDGITAIICDNDEKDIQQCFRKLLDNPQRIKDMKEQQMKSVCNNDMSLALFKEWLK